jgi:hypothetical protein
LSPPNSLESQLSGDALVLAFRLFAFCFALQPGKRSFTAMLLLFRSSLFCSLLCSLAWEAELHGDALALVLLERKLHDGVMTRLPARSSPECSKAAGIPTKGTNFPYIRHMKAGLQVESVPAG